MSQEFCHRSSPTNCLRGYLSDSYRNIAIVSGPLLYFESIPSKIVLASFNSKNSLKQLINVPSFRNQSDNASDRKKYLKDNSWLYNINARKQPYKLLNNCNFLSHFEIPSSCQFAKHFPQVKPNLDTILHEYTISSLVHVQHDVRTL